MFWLTVGVEVDIFIRFILACLAYFPTAFVFFCVTEDKKKKDRRKKKCIHQIIPAIKLLFVAASIETSE